VASAVGDGETPVLYFKRGCTSCEKARTWLADHGIAVAEREIFKRPLSASEIEDVIGSRPVTDVLSTRTTEYRARGLDQGTHSDAELLRQMEAEPRLLRRPLLQIGDRLLVGFDQARWAAAFGVRPK
jgi:Spx/MgsR family transcriptional regulator